MKRAALYARFSSDLQKDRSIDDQLHACQNVAKRENLKIVATFSDRAKSGAVMFERDGLIEMMREAKARKFDFVIVESLDRLSRDQADLAGIFKRLKFWDIQINTVQEGIATALHVGIRGITSSLFLTDIAHKIKRGHDGRVREGKFPGAVTYGYRRVPGKPGEREIDQDQAEIVRRIFREYAAGTSPRAIATGLTRDKIPTPNGARAWNMQTFIGGGAGHKRGIITNRLYIGEIIWNTRRSETDPDSGTQIRKPTPQSEWLTTPVPHLRIVDQRLWDAANKVREDRAVAKFGPNGTVIRRNVVPRTNHLLAGLLRCEACGGRMRIANTSRNGNARVACAAAHQHGTCDHNRSYDLEMLQRAVVQGLEQLLLDPEKFARFEKGFMSQLAAKRSENTDLQSAQKKLNQVTVQIDRVVDAIASLETTAVKALTDKLEHLEHERAGLTERVRLLQAESAVVRLHPTALRAYRENIARLLQSMAGTNATANDHAAFRMLFDSIIVHRTEKRMPYEITPYARIGGTLDANLAPPKRPSRQVLEEAGVFCTDADNTAKTVLAISQPKTVCLGRWKYAA